MAVLKQFEQDYDGSVRGAGASTPANEALAVSGVQWLGAQVDARRVDDALFLANYANINIVDALYRVSGVGEVRVFGSGDYAMRIWVKPDRLATMGLTIPEIVKAIHQQSTVNPAGQVGGQPSPTGQDLTYTVRAPGRLQTPEEFASRMRDLAAG